MPLCFFLREPHVLWVTWVPNKYIYAVEITHPAKATVKSPSPTSTKIVNSLGYAGVGLRGKWGNVESLNWSMHNNIHYIWAVCACHRPTQLPMQSLDFGGGSAGNGWTFDHKIHYFSGRFDGVLLLWGQDILIYGIATRTKFQRLLFRLFQ